MGRSFHFASCPAGHPLRPALEHGIAATYAHTYGATLEAFPRLLIALVEGTAPLCAAGIRSEPELIFSQNYLDQPIHRLLNAPAGRVIEVCHFTAFRSGVGPALLPHIVAFGLSLGADWAVFTATSQLRCLLKRARLPLVRLAAARQERAPRSESWGSYYDHDPWVCAISADVARLDASFSEDRADTGRGCHG